MNSLTLYDIESKLAELLQIEASIKEDPDITPEDQSKALAAINQEINDYFAREVKKVDNIANAIRAYTFAADEVDAEITRLEDRRRALVATADRIKQSTINAMQAHRIKRVETPTNVLRIQANGGLAPLIVDDPTKLNVKFLKAAVYMPLQLWNRISRLLTGGRLLNGLDLTSVRVVRRPDNDRIRAAIKEGEDVPAHLGDRGSHLRLS